jgi:2-dehydro-3-deoxyphosphogluconate aldolase/(4S)-4-hydroxy-2-oxoglutarate aldolase
VAFSPPALGARMDEFEGTLGRIVDGGVVAVMRGVDRESVVDLGEALRAGGVTAMEVTAETPGAEEMIATLADRFADDDAVAVGAGTVLDTETARAVVSAGAEFVVSPTLDGDVVELCNRYGVVSAPGVFTPAEALTAYEAGADVVKVFPAKTGGPGHVSAIKGPLGQIPIVPTGGVGPDNAADYIEAGAAAVGVGSALISDEVVAQGEFAAVEATARELVEVVQAARA